jgi:hypothetical protein
MIYSFLHNYFKIINPYFRDLSEVEASALPLEIFIGGTKVSTS